ncbi:hypothetical protein Mal64_13930 [Pseudobythopirellula maris]|uniref:Uncharacterized protein n=1 Tax=Pseudobythopirellula maris TaxID=2527991 RepID=A0A5C5ZTV3_9BACT|nr:hypothetical protein [Pseudobythopirellula maris]TWT90994.1 hypothetical protein Mal64_13930 [Pseudobythopirellula maris]
MAIAWNAAGDFGALLDGLETLTLHRNRGEEPTTIAAWRFSSERSELADSGGALLRVDTVWQFEWPQGVDPPEVGDQLIDSHGNCGALLTVGRLRGETRLRCVSREARLHHGRSQSIDVVRQAWEDLGEGAEVVSEETIAASARAVIRPIATAFGDEQSTPRYSAVLDSPIAIAKDDLLRTHEGPQYRVTTLTDPGGLGSLFTVEATLVA